MSMKIRGHLAAQMTMDELRQLSVMAGKTGAKARDEIHRRTGEVIAKPANAVKATRAPKVSKPKPDDQAPMKEVA